MGFEPMTYRLTACRSNQLNYIPKFIKRCYTLLTLFYLKQKNTSAYGIVVLKDLPDPFLEVWRSLQIEQTVATSGSSETTRNVPEEVYL